MNSNVQGAESLSNLSSEVSSTVYGPMKCTHGKLKMLCETCRDLGEGTGAEQKGYFEVTSPKLFYTEDGKLCTADGELVPDPEADFDAFADWYCDNSVTSGRGLTSKEKEMVKNQIKDRFISTLPTITPPLSSLSSAEKSLATEVKNSLRECAQGKSKSQEAATETNPNACSTIEEVQAEIEQLSNSPSASKSKESSKSR